MFISNKNKQRWLSDHGYVVFRHEKMSTSPSQVRHILREALPGWYVGPVFAKKPSVLNLKEPLSVSSTENFAVHMLFYIAVAHAISEVFKVVQKDSGFEVYQPGTDTPVFSSETLKELVEDFGYRLGILDGYYTQDMPNMSEIGDVGVPTLFTPVYTPEGTLIALVVRKEDASLLWFASEMYEFVCKVAESATLFSEEARFLLAEL